MSTAELTACKCGNRHLLDALEAASIATEVLPSETENCMQLRVSIEQEEAARQLVIAWCELRYD